MQAMTSAAPAIAAAPAEWAGVEVPRPPIKTTPLRVAAGCARLVIVAPRPADEILGVGGLIASLAALGMPVCVVAASDGEASHAPGDWWTPSRLRDQRRRES